MSPALQSAEAANDCKSVIDAAAALDVREIDFFRLAFRRWFGRDASPRVLERAFAAYMFRKIVPQWARHFSRLVLADAAAGRLEAARLGAMAYRRQPPPHRHGRLYVGLTLVAVAFYCLALLRISYDPETSAPLPCYGGPGFKLWAGMAHAVSGKPLPECPPAGEVRRP